MVTAPNAIVPHPVTYVPERREMVWGTASAPLHLLVATSRCGQLGRALNVLLEGLHSRGWEEGCLDVVPELGRDEYMSRDICRLTMMEREEKNVRIINNGWTVDM